MNETLAMIRQNGVAIGIAALVIIAALVGSHLIHARPGTAFARHERQFNHDCVEGGLNGTAPPSCAGFAAMRAAYGFEPMNELIAARAKMIDTARRLAHGDIPNRDAYDQCLKRGECAPVPNLPPHADPHSAQSRATMAEFWHLVNGGDLTKGECDMMDVCRAFVALKLIPPPPALKGGVP